MTNEKDAKDKDEKDKDDVVIVDNTKEDTQEECEISTVTENPMKLFSCIGKAIGGFSSDDDGFIDALKKNDRPFFFSIILLLILIVMYLIAHLRSK